MRHLPYVIALTLLVSGPAFAGDIYVSSETGKNENPGTKEAPKKLLWKVMGDLKAGDHVFVAEGRQEGQGKSGIMPRVSVENVTIEGGWKADFSARDPFKHLTIVAAPADQAGATGRAFHFEAGGATLDGFCIDRGAANNYYADGEPGANKRIEGHQDSSPWGYRNLNRKSSGSDPAVELSAKGRFTVRNLILINCPWWGIYVKCGGNEQTTIENNLILVSQGRGMEVIAGGGWGQPTIGIKNNTVAFNHTLKSTEGRALSLDPKPTAAKYVVEGNVLAFSDGCGIDTKFRVKGEAVILKNNLFFLNRFGDFGPADNGTNVSTFDDELEVKQEGNVHEIPKFLAKISKGWLDRWSQREGLLLAKWSTEEEIMAARAVHELKEYHLAGYPDPFPTYSALPGARPNYEMSRYPRPLKKGETFDWAADVLPVIGADGARGIQPFAAK